MKLNIHPTVKFDQPVMLQGDGTLTIYENVTVGYNLAVAWGQPVMLQARYADSQLCIGRDTFIANGAEIIAAVSIGIGENCRIGKCLILDTDAHGLKVSERDSSGKSKRVIIGDSVFIGHDATILKGVVIGKGSVIGAGAVVRQNLSIPPYSIVVGNPATVVGYIDETQGKVQLEYNEA